MFDLKRISLVAALGLATAWGCTPEEYPSEPRFEIPEEVELPAGELFFYLPANGGPAITSIHVAGEMNGWNATANPMEQLSDGRWVAGIDMLPGTYQYKYVFNGGTWAQNMCADDTWGNPAGGPVDPDVVDCIDDGFGGANGVRVVTPPGHTFLYVVPEGVEVSQVNLAGSFQTPTQWSMTANPLANIWTVTVAGLPAGNYEYKYIFNGDQWAGNMCNEGTWGDPDNGNMVDPNGTGCVSGGENGTFSHDGGDHTFIYIVPASAPAITAVNVAGSFQSPAQWSMTATPMQETFSTTLVIPSGSYEYKYIFNVDQWASDMCNDATWGDPDNDNKVDPNVTACAASGGNALLTIP